jgi:hypothetical protein
VANRLLLELKGEAQFLMGLGPQDSSVYQLVEVEGTPSYFEQVRGMLPGRLAGRLVGRAGLNFLVDSGLGGCWHSWRPALVCLDPSICGHSCCRSAHGARGATRCPTPSAAWSPSVLAQLQM